MIDAFQHLQLNSPVPFFKTANPTSARDSTSVVQHGGHADLVERDEGGVQAIGKERIARLGADTGRDEYWN